MKPLNISRTPSGLAQLGVAVALAGIAANSQAQTLPFSNRAAFMTAAPQATTTFGFERGLPSGTGTGFIGPFTEAGFVTFLTQANYVHEIADGLNLGQGGNDVYLTLAANKGLPITDVTFGAGVTAFGFDFKNTSNGPSSAGLVPQSFTFNLFAGSTSLGSFTSSTLVGGTAFQFLGFTSSTPITEMTIVATVPGASPNLDIVLDNFAVATPVPEPASMALFAIGLVGVAVVRRQRPRGMSAVADVDR